MKTPNLLLLLLALTTILGACTPKNEPRYVQEPEKKWTPAQAPLDESVDAAALNQVNLSSAYALLKNPKADVMKGILKPLSRYVLNSKFVATPGNHSERMIQLVGIFESAFLKELQAKNKTAEFQKIKQDYISTVFDGCTEDLQVGSCTTADLFASQAPNTPIFTLIASELDADIEAHLKEAHSPSRCVGILPQPNPADEKPYLKADECRNLVEARYRFLSMAIFNKRTHFEDGDFDFAYLKYASLFQLFVQQGQAAQLNAKANVHSSMSYSYLATLNSSIYQTIILRYEPTDYNQPEFKAFVSAAHPWLISAKQPNAFLAGMNKIFEYATKCCMYTDSTKNKLVPDLTEAIKSSQLGADHYGPSVTQMIKVIKYPAYALDEQPKKKNDPAYDASKDEPNYELFTNLKMMDLVARVENPNSDFYNEFFFIVDRLFRGHLTSEQAESVLNNTNQARALMQLPRMITDYMKIYLVYQVFKTNQFMAGIYHSNISSDQVFERAIVRSRDLTDQWHMIQSSIDLLDKLMGSYYKGRNINPDLSAEAPKIPTPASEFNMAYNTIKSVNRNIHYLSVFPNMIVMNYFLSKMNGQIKISSWWGEIVLDGASVLKSFFDGEIGSPWFQFGVDTEALDRVMLLYSLEYLVSTKALDSFVATEANGDTADQSRFFDLIFSKYMDDSVTDLRSYLTTFEQNTVGTQEMAAIDPMCDYEDGKGGTPPHVAISFMQLDQYTYSGIEAFGVNRGLGAFLSGLKVPVNSLRTKIQGRRLYLKAMTQELAQVFAKQMKDHNPNLTDADISAKIAVHPNLAKAREMLKNLDDMESELISIYTRQNRRYFRCASTLLEIEKRRTKHLYELERQHLGEIFDAMVPLVSIRDGSTLDREVARINAQIFTPANGYRFDQIDGLTYRMSKYDLLMRMKRRIEGDKFVPTPAEVINFGESRPSLLRARSVSVYEPDGLERDPMVNNRINVPIYIHGTKTSDREDFIRQGMATMNGGDNAFIKWSSNFAKDLGALNYLGTMEELYLLGPVKSMDGGVAAVTKEELTEAYIKTYAALTLDNLDIKNAIDFGTQGRYQKSFFQGKLFEKDGQTRLAFFYGLMNDINTLANTSLKANGEVRQALDFAKGFINLQTFVFEPSTASRDSVQVVYGASVNSSLKRINDLFSYLMSLEKKYSDVGALDGRLRQAFYVEGGRPVYWYDSNHSNMTDHQKYDDHQILIDNFTVQSGDFFGTNAAMKGN